MTIYIIAYVLFFEGRFTMRPMNFEDPRVAEKIFLNANKEIEIANPISKDCTIYPSSLLLVDYKEISDERIIFTMGTKKSDGTWLQQNASFKIYCRKTISPE